MLQKLVMWSWAPPFSLTHDPSPLRDTSSRAVLEAPSMKRLEGRSAVVIGGGQTPGETIGNGRATAITFAREGARLLLVDREPTSLEETATLAKAEGAEVRTFVADVAADGAPEQIVEAAV